MSTRILLLRHAQHDLAGRALAGRMAGLGLNAQGRAQAERLAGAPLLQRENIAALYSSPQPRAQQTLAPLAAARGMAIAPAPEFDEIDFGAWTGLSFEQLRDEGEAWRVWVHERSRAQPPGGEPFADVQRRVASGMERLRRAHEGQTVLVASHADVIKAALATHLGMSLDGLERFEIGCASLSAIEAGEGDSRVTLLNAPLI